MDINLLIPNPWNFNKMSEDDHKQLQDDIKLNGIRDPITVRKKDEKYEVLDGDQRLQEWKLLGNTVVPDDKVVIVSLSDAEARSYIRSKKIRGNRVDLIKEAEHYLEDYTASGLSLTEYSKSQYVFMDVSKLSRILKRNNMNLPSKDFVQRNDISASVLDAILNANPDSQLTLLRMAVEEKWSTEKATEVVKTGLTLEGKTIRDEPKKQTDTVKFDMTDRAVLVNIMDHLLQVCQAGEKLAESKGSLITAKTFSSLTSKFTKMKNEYSGYKQVYNKDTKISTVNEIHKWLNEGTQDDRKAKYAKINERLKELGVV